MLVYSVKTHIDDSEVQAFIQSTEENKVRANRLAGLVVLRDAQKRFDTQGYPPDRWTDIKEATKRRRRQGKKTSRGIKILIDEGTLRRSLMPGDANNLYATDAGGAVVGTKLIYAAVHQFGYEDRNIPKRQYLYSPAEYEPLREEVLNIYRRVLMGDKA